MRSSSLSKHQKIVEWLDHPGLGVNKPSILMDQLNTLQPSSIVEVQKILFLRKMPAYIRDMINLKDFQDLPALTDQCDEIWKSRSQDLATVVAAAVIPRQHSPARGGHRSSSPFHGRRPAAGSPATAGHPRPRRPRRRLLFLPRPLRLPRQEVQEWLHIPGKRVGLRWSPAPLPLAPLTPADPPTQTPCHFLLAAVATLLLGMDFLRISAHLSSPPNSRFCTRPRAAPSPGQVPHPVYPLRPRKPPPPLPSSRHRYSNCSRNFRRCCAPAPPPPPPKHLHGVVHHINTGSAAPVFARPQAVGPVQAQHHRGGVSRHGKSRYLLQLALGVPAAPGTQERQLLAPLQRLPPPERSHHT